MRRRRRRVDFPVLLAGWGTRLFITGGSETLLTAGGRDVAVLQVVVLGALRPVHHRASTQTDRKIEYQFV